MEELKVINVWERINIGAELTKRELEYNKNKKINRGNRWEKRYLKS